MTEGNAVEFDNVNIVFGDSPETALPLMDRGMARGPIKAETAQVLGVHNCSLAVREGEILVLMGLSGSGKSTLLRAVNGLNQVYGVLTNTYERPVPAPVHGLSDAELTCGECHDPERDLGDLFRVTTDYSADDANTPLKSVLLMHVGGRGATTPGIHSWHLSPGREIEYYAADEKRETISYVKVQDADGASTENIDY